MTKDVELHTTSWHQMKGAIGSLTETASRGASTYGSSSFDPGRGYYTGGASGFQKQIQDLVAISEKAKRLIQEKDSDGVVSYSYHDDCRSAQTLQGKLERLEAYSGQVSTYVKEKIDRPFYEAMDKIGARLESLSISSYTTKNTVGFKRTETVTDVYGHPMGTREVQPATISLADLYQVESPYKATLQRSYQEFKKSDAYKENKLSQEDYLLAMHHTRAFTYHSLDEERENQEFWRDLTLGAGVVILTIFCPPAGAAAGFLLASADMYSAVTGKDWGTGRELDGTERGLRAGFALFDILPGVGYVNDLAKSGSKLAAKEFLQTSLQKGFMQGAKNLDSFKGLVKNLGQFGDNLLKNMDSYAKQVDNLAKSKVSSIADNLAGKLRHVDDTISEAARNFSLNNFVLEPQLVSGAMSSTSPGRLSGMADNLQAFAKSLDGSVDEVVVPKSLNGYSDLAEFTTKVAKSDLSLDDKVKKLHEAFDNLANKADINVPSDPQYLKGFTEWGTPDYDWPPKLGYQEETIRGITREAGLPDTWDRYGYMGGGNFSDVPSSGPYTYSERAIPYLENPEAYHTGTFNKSTYFDKIDAIREGNLNKLNGILESEGIEVLTQLEFSEFGVKYNTFIQNTYSSIAGNIQDYTYGIYGKAARWGDMIGGAVQIVTPFNGQDMLDLGMMIQRS